MDTHNALWHKYNVPVPRYTSYPAVPNWSQSIPSDAEWMQSVNNSLKKDRHLSIYIHLPFCEQLCTYCACNKRITKNHKVESPYINTLLQEWQFYISNLKEKPILQELHLGGGTPTFFNPEELERLIGTIISSVEVADTAAFAFEAHPDSTSEEHLKTLYQLGFKRISIGVQDISTRILEAINRKQTIDQVLQVTNKAREIGYQSINYDIIYGLPFQDEDNIRQTMKLIEKMMPDRLAFYAYAHVPWKSKGQRAFTKHDIAHGLEKHNLKLLGERLLRQMGYYAIAMDHYALATDSLFHSYASGQLHRNFMGFTDSKTNCLIGLGNSAISDSGTMYIQNEKGVETYEEKIQQGGLAIIKGHTLSESEKRVREHILNLICNDQTKSNGDQLDQAILIPAIQRLSELIHDGLVIVHHNQIKITDPGKPFVRNICAKLDPYLDQPTTKNRYSMSI